MEFMTRTPRDTWKKPAKPLFMRASSRFRQILKTQSIGHRVCHLCILPYMEVISCLLIGISSTGGRAKAKATTTGKAANADSDKQRQPDVLEEI